VLQQTVAFDEDPVRSIHENIGDIRVVHQRLERTEAVDLVHDLADHLLAMLAAQIDFFEGAKVRGQCPQLLSKLVFIHVSGFGQIDRVDHPAVQMRLEALELLARVF
jgi:hypothetical protein